MWLTCYGNVEIIVIAVKTVIYDRNETSIYLILLFALSDVTYYNSS